MQGRPTVINDYREASFGGAVFYVSQSQDAFGRRGAHHEFPYQDRGLWDDLGAKDGRRQIEAYLTNFLPGGMAAARDRLITALAKGEGELVHPWLGRHKVVCTDYSVGHNEKEIGLCRVSITFIDASATSSEPADNPVAGLLSGCDGALSCLADMFSARYSVAGVLAFVAEASYGRLDGLLSGLRSGLSLAQEIEAALSPFIDLAVKWFGVRKDNRFSLPIFVEDSLSFLSENWQTISPAELATYIIGLATLTVPASGTANEAYGRMSDLWTAARAGLPFEAPPRSASSSSIQTINRNFAALDFIFQGAAAVEAARLTPWLNFEHQGQAESVRVDLIDRFDILAEQVGTAVESEAADRFYQHSRKITAAALEIVGITAPNLALLGSRTLKDCWPSVRLCYELYGNLEREGDLINRNRIAHPGFMPGGSAVEYLIDV
ncbi:hypothetical protein C4J81_15340 [Deltaproteobacteria bacterium Smac51]|nr:hypothetical protein C4J81_10075 [Deltaproteobacteria bacterium Smac51]UQZ90505.1 hypothetical protein C4J81_15340 [Deltaproteobacteria bacterium Smac51]